MNPKPSELQVSLLLEKFGFGTRCYVRAQVIEITELVKWPRSLRRFWLNLTPKRLMPRL